MSHPPEGEIRRGESHSFQLFDFSFVSLLFALALGPWPSLCAPTEGEAPATLCLGRWFAEIPMSSDPLCVLSLLLASCSPVVLLSCGPVILCQLSVFRFTPSS
jgi:hypothetical protein